MDEDQTNAALSFTLRRDTVSAVLAVEGPITEILGYEPHELIGVTSVDLLHPADSDAGVTSWVQMLLGPTLEGRFRGRYRHRDGSWIWVDTHNVNKLDDPDFACVMSIITVTDEADVSIHEQLRAQREVLARLNELLPVGLLHVSIDGRVIESNQLLRDLVGVEDPRRLDDLIAAVAPADRGLIDDLISVLLAGGEPHSVELSFVSGRNCLIDVRHLTGPDGAVSGALAVLSDITSQAAERDEYAAAAATDTLTGLCSRRSLLRSLEELLEAGRTLTLAFVDLDGFKAINDEYGHHIGDLTLIETGRRLAAVVRDGDVVGRMGGDEFVVIMPASSATASSETIRQRLESAFRRVAVVEGVELQLRASIGVVKTSELADVSDAVTLLGRADEAMYAVKRSRQRAAAHRRSVRQSHRP